MNTVAPQRPPAWNDGRALAWTAAAMAVAAALWGLADAAVFHPGVEAWDAVDAVAKAADLLHGQAQPFRADSGWLQLHLLAAVFNAAGSGPLAMRLPNLFCFALECFLLWRLASAWAGPLAAFGALAVHCLAAATWLRLRIPLSYVQVPAELLTALWLLEGDSPWRGLALGLLAGLGLADYGAWPAALPVLTAAWWVRPSGQRPAAGWILAAAGAVAAALALGTRAYSSSYLLTRLGPAQGSGPSYLSTWLHGAWRYFSGQGQADQLLGSLPAFPLWALPFLAAGLLFSRGRRWPLAAWALLGLAPLALPGNVAEANRAIVAWPALCLLSGLGLAALLRPWPRRTALLFGCAWICVGGAAEARAYTDMQSRCDPLSRSYWRRLEAAAQVLRQRGRSRPLRLLSDLDWRPAAELSLRAGLADRGPGSETWALLPREYVPWPLDPAWGLWVPLSDPELPGAVTYLCRLAPAQAPRFIARDQWLADFRRRCGPNANALAVMKAAQDALGDPGLSDPWLRRSLLDLYVHRVMEAQQDPALCLPVLLAEPRLSPWEAAIAAQALAPTDPRRALALAEQSVHGDPDRAPAVLLRDRLRQALAQPVPKR
jgi:hypothetical protein